MLLLHLLLAVGFDSIVDDAEFGKCVAAGIVEETGALKGTVLGVGAGGATGTDAGAFVGVVIAVGPGAGTGGATEVAVGARIGTGIGTDVAGVGTAGAVTGFAPGA